jgi:Glycosyltransferase family 87
VRRPHDSLVPWIVLGAIAWAGVLWIGWALWQNDPPRAGFDLTLLLDAARKVLDGQSPYDPAILAGASPDAVSLFYSYPPPVAQAMTLVAWLPDGVALILWGLAATLALGFISSRLAGPTGRDPTRTAIQVMCVAPLVFPFAIAVLFGNLDAWYPLAYGAVLLAVLPGSSTRTRILAGVALGAIIVAKLQPAPMLLWLIVMASLVSRRRQASTALVTVVTGVSIAAVSLVLGGLQPWLDYVKVVQAGAGSDLVDPRNIGPTSLIGQLTGADSDVLRWVQAIVVVAVIVATVATAIRIGDRAFAFAVAATVSLVTLPVTWFHYPVALLPAAILIAIASPPSRPTLMAAGVVAAVAIAWLPLTWVAVALLLVAVARATRRRYPSSDAPPVPGTERTTGA